MPTQELDTAWRDPSVAARYANAENATRPFAKILVDKTNLAKATEGVNVFDLATGTGALVAELYAAIPYERWGDVKVLGGDVSASMLAYLKARGETEGWSGLETGVVDGNKIELAANTYTHAFCTFGIFAMPTCLTALHTLLQPGGFVGVSTWKSLAWYPLLTRSIALMPSSPLNPSEQAIKDTMYAGCAWDSPSYLASRLREAGFVEVQTEVKAITARVGTPEAFMDTISFALKILVAPLWPAETREALMKELEGAMRKEVDGMAGEDGEVEMEFEGVVGWGVKG